MTTDKDALLREALDWIEAQLEPRMIGASKVITGIRAALSEPQGVVVPRDKLEYLANNLPSDYPASAIIAHIKHILAAAKEPQGDGWIKRRMVNMPHPHEPEMRVIGFVVPVDETLPLGMVSEALEKVINGSKPLPPLPKE